MDIFVNNCFARNTTMSIFITMQPMCFCWCMCSRMIENRSPTIEKQNRCWFMIEVWIVLRLL